MVDLVPATKADLAAIIKIYNHYILNSTASFHTEMISQKDLGEFLFIGHPKYPSFVITDHDKILGFCYLRQFKQRPAYDRSAELSIYLKPEFTGKGFGRYALSNLETAAKKAGIHMLVGTLCSENQASIQLLENAGYSRCGYLKNIGEKFGRVLDVVIYQKEI